MKMIRNIIIASFFLLGPAQAQNETFGTYVTGLAAAGAITGSERMFALQTGTPKTLTPYQILSGIAGDCTMVAAPSIVCLKTNGVAFAPSATTDTTNANNISGGTLNTLRLPAPFTSGTRSGNTSNFMTGTGSFTNGHFAGFDVNGNITDFTPSGNTTVPVTAAVGTKTLNHVVTWDVNGNVQDGGAAGSGTVTETKFTAGSGITLTGNCDIVNSNSGSPCLISGSASEVGMVKLWPTTNKNIPANHFVANGASAVRATFPLLFAVLVHSATVTFTNSSALITWTAHPLSPGDKVKFFTTVALPTNFTAGTHGYNVGTEYCVIATGMTANAFEVSTTCNGSAISAGSAGSGTQTAVNAPWGDGDGSTTYTLPNLVGEFLRFWQDGTGSIDVARLFGAEQVDAFQGHVFGVTDLGHAHGYIIPTFPGSGTTIQTGNGLDQVGAGSTTSVGFANIQVTGPNTDGVNGTPRTAGETRSRNHALLPIIRYQ
jgi:hypothetical protein